MKLRIVQFMSIFLLILVTGVFWGTWFGLGRSIGSVSPATYLENAHTVFRNLALPMRILFPAALLSTVGLLVELFRQRNRNRPGPEFLLPLLGLFLFVVALMVTLKVNVPIDNQVSQWTVSSLPSNWQEMRDRWLLFHTIRTFASLGGLVLILAGTLLFKDEKAA